MARGEPTIQPFRPWREGIHGWNSSGSPSPWPGRGGTEDYSHLGLCRLVILAIPEHAPWERAGVVAVFEQHLAVDDGVMNPSGQLSDAPAAGRKIVHGVLRQRVDGVGIEDRNISREARAEEPTIVDAERRGRLEGQPSHRVLQRHDALLAHPVAEQTRAVAIAPVELHVGAAVGETDIGVGVVEDLRHGRLIDVRSPLQEHGIQMFLDRQIQEGVDDALALSLRHFTNRLALPALVLRQHRLTYPDVVVPTPTDVDAG